MCTHNSTNKCFPDVSLIQLNDIDTIFFFLMKVSPEKIDARSAKKLENLRQKCVKFQPFSSNFFHMKVWDKQFFSCSSHGQTIFFKSMSETNNFFLKFRDAPPTLLMVRPLWDIVKRCLIIFGGLPFGDVCGLLCTVWIWFVLFANLL